MNLTAIILAGGQSRRMGKNKALITYQGKPLILYSIELALEFTRNIIISAKQSELRKFGFPVVQDILHFNAPLAGIHASLKYSKTKWNLVLTCDMPNVTIGIIQYLITKLDENTSLVLPGHDGYIEPLCGLYHKDLIPVIESNVKKDCFSPLDLLVLVPHRIITLDRVLKENLSQIFKNVNSRQDLQEIN